MRILLLSLAFMMFFAETFSQVTNPYQSGISAEQNLKAIRDIAPYSNGGVGFDTRYQGIKGSPMLNDTLLPSFLMVEGQTKYITLDADLDVYNNTVVFRHPQTGKMLALPSGFVTEIVISRDGEYLRFITTKGRNFDKTFKGPKFCLLLFEGPYYFIRMPDKLFLEANFKGAYSADRRYDEFETIDRYFIMGKDGLFHQIQLTRKTLTRLFPGSSDMIDRIVEEKNDRVKEQMVVSMLGNL